MSLGVLMLVHTAFDRAEEVARHWAKNGCPVIIHVDHAVPKETYDLFQSNLSDVTTILFCKRHRCEWGTWGLVAATQSAAELMLEQFDQVRHVYLSSGSCLPLRPVSELREYLDERPNVDFIESATTPDVPWTVGGLSEERFTLFFPFSWRERRFWFDKFVHLQRILGIKRRIPRGLVPHMGSQWWCLTRSTLINILKSPNRRSFDRYFKRVWIPDESYFQTLTRLYSTQVESRSLTLSKFDFQGKPHIFYDDHLQLLRRSDCFVARKIWPQANELYSKFLSDGAEAMPRQDPNPGKIDRIFSRALDRRVRGRPGLYMHSRYPNKSWQKGVTAERYFVFQGFSDLFEDFQVWLSQATNAQVHGHLFKPAKAEFADRQTSLNGAISNAPKLRDANPNAFLANLIWNTRGARQCFQFGPSDSQPIAKFIANDANARINVVTGAWAVPLFRSNKDFSLIRAKAARLQKIETEALRHMRAPTAKARIKIWSMAEFIEAPMEPLQAIVDEVGNKQPELMLTSPTMRSLDGFGQFLQKLKNEGMHPYLMGDFPVEAPTKSTAERSKPRKPYLVKK